jgi:hypothetical protein
LSTDLTFFLQGISHQLYPAEQAGDLFGVKDDRRAVFLNIFKQMIECLRNRLTNPPQSDIIIFVD